MVVIGGSCFTSSLNDEACGLEFFGRLSLSTNCTSGGGEADAITCETTGMCLYEYLKAVLAGCPAPLPPGTQGSLGGETTCVNCTLPQTLFCLSDGSCHTSVVTGFSRHCALHKVSRSCEGGRSTPPPTAGGAVVVPASTAALSQKPPALVPVLPTTASVLPVDVVPTPKLPLTSPLATATPAPTPIFLTVPLADLPVMLLPQPLGPPPSATIPPPVKNRNPHSYSHSHSN